MSKSLQASKIREIAAALDEAGCQTIEEKARALGLGRSTTWAILRAGHKNSGLTASVVNTILASPRLPPAARIKLREYVEDKVARRYGHKSIQVRRFVARLGTEMSASKIHPILKLVSDRIPPRPVGDSDPNPIESIAPRAPRTKSIPRANLRRYSQ